MDFSYAINVIYLASFPSPYNKPSIWHDNEVTRQANHLLTRLARIYKYKGPKYN